MTDHEGRSTLVIGGARSGKSTFAEKLCEESDKSLLYIATSPILSGDLELDERIRLHQDRRGPRWALIEEELKLSEVLDAHNDPKTAILVDCLTLWINNLQYHDLSVPDHLQALKSSLSKTRSKVVLISNEVGQGVIPSNAESTTLPRLPRHNQSGAGRSL